MRHLKSFNQLNRTNSERKALYRNMIFALLKNNRIKTTVPKAKEIRRVVEKLITRAKVKNIHNIRIVAKMVSNKDLLKKLFDDIAPRYATRNGGYTRIIKADRRKGDGAELAFLELITEETQVKKKKKKIKKEDIKRQDESGKKEVKEEVKEEVKSEETANKPVDETKVENTDSTTTQVKEENK